MKIGDVVQLKFAARLGHKVRLYQISDADRFASNKISLKTAMDLDEEGMVVQVFVPQRQV